MSHLYQIGWFSSGGSQTSRDLLSAVVDSIRRDEIKAEIAFVFCSREPGESIESDAFLKLVQNYGIPLVSFSYREFKAGQDIPARDASGKLADWRMDYDRQVIARLEGFEPDLCVLAGYMLITGPEMCRKFDMINLHPAAPGGPVGTWRQVIWKLIEANARETGVLMHLVTPELDKGPELTYGKFSIRGEPFDRYWQEIEGLSLQDIKQRDGADNPLFKLIRRYGLAREIPLILATIKIFSRGTLRVNSNKLVIDVEDYPILAFDLTGEIEEQLKTL